MHAWQREEGAQPDLQIVGKGLGGGYAPISAILISKGVVDVFRAGSGVFNNGWWHSFLPSLMKSSNVLTLLRYKAIPIKAM